MGQVRKHPTGPVKDPSSRTTVKLPIVDYHLGDYTEGASCLFLSQLYCRDSVTYLCFVIPFLLLSPANPNQLTILSLVQLSSILLFSIHAILNTRGWAQSVLMGWLERIMPGCSWS